MANRFPPLFSTPMISAPQAAPIALPRAPDRLAPPMTQAAIARRPVHLAPAFLRRAGPAPRVDRSSADRAGGKFPAAEPSLEEAEGPGTYVLGHHAGGRFGPRESACSIPRAGCRIVSRRRRR